MSRHWMTLTLCSCLALAGCSNDEFTEYGDAPKSENTETGHSHDAVHGGQLIEFDAAHAHHAELVFDAESRDITLYFYGAEVGEAHPASGLTIELEEGEDELELKNTASPLEGETEETASRFVVAGSEVPEDIKSIDDLMGHFHVTLDEQDFRGSFGSHDGHDHGEHGHEHGDHGHDGEDDDHDEDHGEDGDKDGEKEESPEAETAE